MTPNNGGAVILDPGAPMEHSREPAAPASPARPKDATPQQTDEAKRIEALTIELEETRRSAAYWRNNPRQAAAVLPEPEPEPDEPLVDAPATPDAEKTDDFLTDLNAAGLEALKKRGVITGEQLATALERLETKLRGEYVANEEARQFDGKLNAEFPELMRANAAVDAGQDPKSPLYSKTAAHFRALVRDSGVKAESVAGRALMLAAARMAKAEMDSEKKDTRNGDEDRRARIEGQPGGGRSRAGGADAHMDAPSELTGVQRQVIANLSRFGVSEAKFRQFQGTDSERRAGRE